MVTQLKHTKGFLQDNDSPKTTSASSPVVIGNAPALKRRKMYTPVNVRHQSSKSRGSSLPHSQKSSSRKSLFSCSGSDLSDRENSFDNGTGSVRRKRIHSADPNPYCKSTNPASTGGNSTWHNRNESLTPAPKLDFDTPKTAIMQTPASEANSSFLGEEAPTPRISIPFPTVDSIGDHPSPISPNTLGQELTRSMSIQSIGSAYSLSEESLPVTPRMVAETPRRPIRSFHSATTRKVAPPPLSVKDTRRKSLGGPPGCEDGANNRKSRFEETFQEICVLGEGNFGCVLKCRNRLDGCLYAVKQTKQRFKGQADRQHVLNEVYALAALCNEADNQHIVRYFGAFVEDGRLYIQTELCDFSLQKYVGQKMEPQQLCNLVVSVVRQLLEGLQILHQQNLVHLDIKPANIFVKNGVYKLGDLGHACLAMMKPESKLENRSERGLEFLDVSTSTNSDEQLPLPPPLETNHLDNHILEPEETPNERWHYDSGSFLGKFTNVIEEGDSRYMAPELLNHEYSDLPKCDIFSLGASVYELCLGTSLPSDGIEWHNIRNSFLDSEALGRVTKPIEYLIRSMLMRNPKFRPNATELLTSGGPSGVLRTEMEKRLVEQQQAAEVARRELEEMRRQYAINGQNAAQASLSFALRRTNTM